MGRWAMGWLSACGALGCTGKEPLKPIDSLEPPEPTTTIETGLDGGYIDATYFLVVGRFAYDPELAKHVGFAPPGQGLSPMQLSVVIMDSTAATEGLNDQTSCTVTLEI